MQAFPTPAVTYHFRRDLSLSHHPIYHLLFFVFKMRVISQSETRERIFLVMAEGF